MTSRIGDLLVRAQLLDPLQLRSALAHQQQWGGRLARIVVEKRFLKEEAVVEALSKALGLPRVELDKVERDAAALAKVDAQYAREKAIFPCALKDNGKTLWVAMADPTDIPTIDELQLKARARIRPVISGEGEIVAAIDLHYLGKARGDEPRAFGMIVPAEDADEDEDGKVVDIAGHTLIRNIKDLVPSEAAAPAGSAALGPAPRASASDLLDDLLGSGPAPTAGWTEEELRRLQVIQDQQEKGARILRAVLDLCVARGLFRVEEYRARLSRG